MWFFHIMRVLGMKILGIPILRMSYTRSACLKPLTSILISSHFFHVPDLVSLCAPGTRESNEKKRNASRERKTDIATRSQAWEQSARVGQKLMKTRLKRQNLTIAWYQWKVNVEVSSPSGSFKSLGRSVQIVRHGVITTV